MELLLPRLGGVFVLSSFKPNASGARARRALASDTDETTHPIKDRKAAENIKGISILTVHKGGNEFRLKTFGMIEQFAKMCLAGASWGRITLYFFKKFYLLADF